MPHNIDLILTLTGGLAAALAFGFLTHKLRLSPIVGYLLAGIAVGPFTPGFVAKTSIAEQLAELGVILLMFGVGMHFHVKELLAVGRIAVPGAIVQISVATGLGVLVTRAAGIETAGGIVFGIAISVASTVVLLRVLSDYDALHTPAGHVAVGWLLVEDLFTVLVLVLLPLLVGPAVDGDASDVAVSVVLAVLKIAALVVFTLVVGRWAIPKMLGFVAATRSRELFTLTVLVTALGIAVGSAKLFGASMALGAFLAGLVVGQSEFSSRAASEALPMRDAFAVLFFVAVGMLFDPTQLVPNLGLTLGTLAVILIGKPIAAILVVVALRRPVKTTVTVAIALAQIGEFSFLLATLGRQLGALSDAATQAIVGAAIVSITLNPFLFRLVEPLSRKLAFLDRRLDSAGAELSPTPPASAVHRIVVVGHGPVGATIVRLLRESGLRPVVIELNHETVARLRSEGVTAIYGDASQRDILERAGVATAGSLVFSAPGSPDAAIRIAKSLNPAIRVLSRTNYLGDVPRLRDAGADAIVAAEGEVALAMTERLLREMGDTPEHLDRLRDSVRAQLQEIVR